jgi:radical SAM protein with 4Fe4S-binding SPASM domain
MICLSELSAPGLNDMKRKSHLVKDDSGIYISRKNENIPGTMLDIELTERCNNNCIHCSINLPADDRAAKLRELDAEEWRRILREAADSGIMTVRFTGGEPLLRPDFPEIYLSARRFGLKVLIFTNARLITQEIADLLTFTPPLEEIEVSVYGMKKKSYEAVTGAPGSYEEFRMGVQTLLDRKIPFVVKSAMLPPNKKEAGELNCWAATIPWMRGSRPSSSMFFEYRGRRDSAARNRTISRLRVSPDETMAFFTRHPESYVREMAEFFDKFEYSPTDSLFTCGTGPACIDAYGVIQPCLTLRDPDLSYDLKIGSLDEALTSVFPRLREMKAENGLYLKRCARCFLKALCDQCPAKSWSEHGTLDTPVDYLCRIAHAQAGYLGLVSKDEKAWNVDDGRERIENFKRRVRK